MIGLETKWECPSCGNVLVKQQPFWEKSHRKKVEDPSGCSCGRKGSFRMLSLCQCEFELKTPEKTE